MNLTDTLLPVDLLGFAYFLWLLIGLQALRCVDWAHLRSTLQRQHVFLGASTLLFLLWIFEVGVRPALGFHFLGITVYTLMFGWALAVLGVSLIMFGVTLLSGDWAALALNALLIGILPVAVSYAVYTLVFRHLPHHLFVYVFLCAFFNAMLAAAVSVLALSSLLVFSEVYTCARLSQEYLPYLPLYLFPEGLLNGMITMAIIGLRPDWLTTYDDAIYLQN